MLCGFAAAGASHRPGTMSTPGVGGMFAELSMSCVAPVEQQHARLLGAVQTGQLVPAWRISAEEQAASSKEQCRAVWAGKHRVPCWGRLCPQPLTWHPHNTLTCMRNSQPLVRFGFCSARAQTTSFEPSSCQRLVEVGRESAGLKCCISWSPWSCCVLQGVGAGAA